MRDQHRAVLAACVLLFCVGCKKDEDTTGPSVGILAPSTAFTAAVPDTFTVRVAVSDDRTVESLSIALNDAAGIPIAPPIMVSVGSPSATIERSLAVTDERIASGTYTLAVRASDGANETRAFRTITVQAAPLRLRALFIVPPEGTAPGTITRIDSVGTVSTWTTVGLAGAAAIDGQSQHLFLADAAGGPLSAIPLAGHANAWSVPDQNAQPLPYFSQARLDPADGRLYVATNDGLVRGYTGGGAQTLNAQAQTGFRPYATAVVGGSLVVEERGISSAERRLAVFALPHGAFLTHGPLDLEIVGLFERNGRVLAFGNRDGQGVVQERDLATGGVFEMQVFEEGPLRAVCRLDEQVFALALPTEVVRFNAATTGVAGLAPLPADALAYETVTGALHVGTGNTVVRVDPVTGATLGSTAVPTAVGRILPLLNR